MGCTRCKRPFVSDEGYEILGIKKEPIIHGGFFGAGLIGFTQQYIYGKKIYQPRRDY